MMFRSGHKWASRGDHAEYTALEGAAAKIWPVAPVVSAWLAAQLDQSAGVQKAETIFVTETAIIS